MLSSPTILQVEEGEHVVNLDDFSYNLWYKIHTLEDLTQKAMGFPNFLLLAHLLAR